MLATLAALAMAASLLVPIARARGGGVSGPERQDSVRHDRATIVTNPTGDFEIFTMNPDGSGVRQLTFNESYDFNPAFSPSGKKIAFETKRDGNFEIYKMNADGTRQVNLTDNAAGGDFEPSYSPDGEVGVRDESGRKLRICKMNANGTQQ